jgi:hypothetical protein
MEVHQLNNYLKNLWNVLWQLNKYFYFYLSFTLKRKISKGMQEKEKKNGQRGGDCERVFKNSCKSFFFM